MIISNFEQKGNGTINGNVTITSEKVFELYEQIIKEKDERIRLLEDKIKPQ